MLGMEVPRKLIHLIKLTMESVECCVRVGGELSDPFTTCRGLRQGDGLACLLFNFALEGAVRQSEIQVGGSVFNHTAQILGYADDIDIIGGTFGAMSEAFTNLEAAAARFGLEVNQSKTKYMLTNATRRAPERIQVNGYTFDTVNEFIYLGSLVTNDNEMVAEVQRRIQAANRCYFGLVPQLKSRVISRTTKLRLYKTLIRPVLTYGSETWTLTKALEEDLRRFERKVLRRILGGTYDPEELAWRRRTNQEVMDLYKEKDVIQFIKVGRLRWAGHVARMSPEEPPRRILDERIYAKRGIGRPKLRWLDCVASDSRSILGTRNWRAAAQNREDWRTSLQEALTPRRVVAP